MAAENNNNGDAIENIENSGYSNNFFQTLRELRRTEQFCDFSLKVGDETIHVHKVVLSIASPYFAAMFQHDTKEKAESTIKLECEATGLKAIIEYIYSGKTALTEENIFSVCSISDYLQIEWVKNQCQQFIKRNLKHTNCFQVRKFADQPSFKELRDHIHNYILKEFHKLINEEGFLQLSFEEIRELIKDDQLCVKFEDNAYKAAINWIKHNLNGRNVHLIELMSHVRFAFVRTEFLRDHIVNESALKNNLQCNQYLVQALTYQITPAIKRSLFWSQAKAIPINRTEKFNVLLAGGMDLKSRACTTTCRVYDVTDSKIFALPNMNTNRWGHSLISLKGGLYSAGGNNGAALRTAECYSSSNKKWNNITSMTNARYNFGICTYNNFIYVVGGYQNSTVEKYDPATGNWYNCPNTPVEYIYCSRAASVENSIYSLGRGSDGVTSCTRFDPREGQWCKFNEKPTGLHPQERFELVSYGPSLFCVTEDSARLDLRINKWDSMPSTLCKRTNYSAVIIANDIYIFGGELEKLVNCSEYVRSVERYNIHDNEWTSVDLMNIEFTRGATVTLNNDFDFN
uniref:Kelch-like protein diablo n=1 Tax=Glossina brevipalpis TaxID=37001 RepID=A0A1A9X2C7_9MUSC